MLEFLLCSMDNLVEAGLLMPPFLANVNPQKRAAERGEYKGKLKYTSLVLIVDKRMKRAKYEQFLLTLAGAYVDYKLYFPSWTSVVGFIELVYFTSMREIWLEA